MTIEFKSLNVISQNVSQLMRWRDITGIFDRKEEEEGPYTGLIFKCL